MKILHTSDWHVGKVLKGRSRLDEQRAVLAEIVAIAREVRPDLVLVAGDLFDTANPNPDATRLVTRTLSALRDTGARVVAVAGNHDNGNMLDALRPWADAAGVALRGTVRSAADLRITGETADGERWRLVALPFLSQRYAVRASEMFDLSAAETTQTYADLLRRMVTALTDDFDTDAVNLVTAHLTVVGGKVGGGEREAHTVQAYAVPVTIFPASAHYVALGHLHREQEVPAPAPVRYSGSPLAVDFGEEENTPGVTLVEVSADTTAKIRHVPVTAAVPLRTVRGTLAELAAFAAAEQEAGDPDGNGDRAGSGAGRSGPDGSGATGGSRGWLRVYVREQPRAGLREEVQQLLPHALEVRIDPQVLPEPAAGVRPARRAGRTPAELFAEYLTARGHDDPAVRALFEELYDEVSTA